MEWRKMKTKNSMPKINGMAKNEDEKFENGTLSFVNILSGEKMR